MKVLLQRVQRAHVDVGEERVGEIGRGLLIFVGVERGDGAGDVEYFVDRTARLRIFEDDAGKMNRSLLDIGGEALVVSQFTLPADTRRGRRPSFARAAPPEIAEALYLQFAEGLRSLGITVATGQFRAMMQVGLINDGPVTLMLDPPADRRPLAGSNEPSGATS